MPRYATSAKVLDIQKRRSPSKHYVYVIEVTWSDGSEMVIYRRYSAFYDLHIGLLNDFPKAAGAEDGSTRILPYLPGKKLLGRSQTHKVAEARSSLIGEYVSSLVKLPEHIARCKAVCGFFEPSDTDIKPPKIDTGTGKEVVKPKKGKRESVSGGAVAEVSDVLLLDKYTAIADYTKQNKGEISFKLGTEFEVVEKAENGWWFVSTEGGLDSGWVPATYLESADEQNEKLTPNVLDPSKNKFIAVQTFKPQNADEVGFEKNAVVQVVDKRLDGWWKIKFGGQEGWAPGSFLKQLSVQEYKPAVLGKEPEKKAAPPRPEPAVKKPPERRSSIVRKSGIGWEGISARMRSASAAKKEEVAQKKNEKNRKSVYVTKAAFTKSDEQGISFPAGAEVEVLDRDPGSGWTYIQFGKLEGWAPSDYLEKQNKKPAPVVPAAPKAASKPAVTNPVVPTAPVASKKPTVSKVSKPVVPKAATKPVVPKAVTKPSITKPATPAKPKPSVSKPAAPAKPKPAVTPAKPAFSNSKPAVTPLKPAAPSKPKPSVSAGASGGGVAALAAALAGGLPGGGGGGAGKKPGPVKPSATKKPTISLGAKPKPAIPQAAKKPSAASKPAVPMLPSKSKPSIPAAPKKTGGPCAKANYTAESDTEITLRKGDALKILEEAGEWVYVQITSNNKEGWAPADFIDRTGGALAAKPKPAVPKAPKVNGSKKCRAKATFNAETDQELSLKAGEMLTEVEPETGGWVCVKNKAGKEGWVPKDYVEAF